MEKFNESLPFDKRMWAEDIKARTNLNIALLPNVYPRFLALGASFFGK